ncbi:MAG: OmpA family protein [Acidobacteria bacterium]|uniref:OmpA family protein n=1 Tax=Candidatus Polarisedimenticola svalbardensis TaxID=2886004 RepID=A0A8J6XYX9_9BACT|nr:OmpA family protein [Candidatus Polarisedimenticola svalbardensis]
MKSRSIALLAVVVALTLVASTGCITKKLYRADLEENNQKVTTLESGIEENERRVADLKTETDTRLAELSGKTEKAVAIGSNAMTAAEEAKVAAAKAADGKLIWSETLSDDRVKFSFDQTEIPDAAASLLDDLAGKIKAYGKAVYVEIEGHTDNIGSDDYNMELSGKRAEAVRRYMNEKGGIPLHAISVIAFGESNPVADNGSSDGRSANRRVVVRVLE